MGQARAGSQPPRVVGGIGGVFGQQRHDGGVSGLLARALQALVEQLAHEDPEVKPEVAHNSFVHNTHFVVIQAAEILGFVDRAACHADEGGYGRSVLLG